MPGPDSSEEVCNALCRSDFYDPLLVGFGELQDGGYCICYYTGGSVPPIKPPKNTEYGQNVYPGNGPVISSTGYSGKNCYAYAQVSCLKGLLCKCILITTYLFNASPKPFRVSQGTGSPTTPGATKSPISPSPTGTATSAPTPRGITDYNFIDSGIVSCSCVLSAVLHAILILNLFFSSAKMSMTTSSLSLGHLDLIQRQ